MKRNKLEQPQPTFFFERSDGTTFAAQETEAWGIYIGKNQILGFRVDRPKLIGTSDGKKMYQAILEAHQLADTNAEKAKERIRQGYEEELAAAKGHIIVPRNMDTIGRNGQPTRIENLQR